jgi:hypothetical protein
VLWFVVWTTLVVATLAGIALLGISLWRKAKALMAQMQVTNDVLAQLQDRVAELEALQPQPAPFEPAFVADGAERERWRSVRLSNRAARRSRRATRHAIAHARWEDLLGPSTRG